MKNILSLVVISTALIGCATTTSMSIKEKNNAYVSYIVDENLSSKDKIRGFKFDSWNTLSDNYLIITGVRKKNYLIEIKKRCYDLRLSNNIKLNRSSSMALYNRKDSISLISQKSRDSISPRGEISQKCYIHSIYPISNIQSDYLVNIGKSSKKES